MKLFRYYNQEILHLMLMILISFLVIMISISFVRYLALAADGAMPLKNAFALLGVVLPNFIDLLLPVSLFLAIVVGLNRLLHDNELLIGFACGMSFSSLILKLFRFSLPVCLICFVLSFAVVPKMVEYQNQLTEINSQNASILNYIQSGRFFALGDNQIVYISNIDLKNRNSQNIFLYQKNEDVTKILLSPMGSISNQGNALANIALENGQEYDLPNTMNPLAIRIASFQHLNMILIPNYDFDNTDLNAVSSLRLIKQHTPRDLIELEWRATLPLAALVLTVIGTVLSDLRPRKSKLVKIFYAIMLFIIYFNLITVIKSLLNHGQFPLFPGLFIVHFGFLLAGIVLLAMRERWFKL